MAITIRFVYVCVQISCLSFLCNSTTAASLQCYVILEACCMAPSCDGTTSHPFLFFFNLCSDTCSPLDGSNRWRHGLTANAYGDWLLAELPVKWIWIIFCGGENVPSMIGPIINHCNRDMWMVWMVSWLFLQPVLSVSVNLLELWHDHLSRKLLFFMLFSQYFWKISMHILYKMWSNSSPIKQKYYCMVMV